MKAVLVMDMPGCCGDCPLMDDDCAGGYCNAHGDDYIDMPDTMGGKPDWCPLYPIPNNKVDSIYQVNMSIDEKWVLCNERLPEYYMEVFVTIEENGKRYATIGHLLGNRIWNTLDGKEAKYTKNVIAWSPFENATNIVVLYNGELN